MTTRSSRRPVLARSAIAVTVTAGLIVSLSAAPAFAVSEDPDRFCDVPGQELAISPMADLEEGEQVTWLSTVKGTAPTTFSGEYVGTLENGLGSDAQGNPRDLLLVKLDGDVVNGTPGSLAAGVWAGASGSPVYDADGALIGAVSYGFSFLADNVAGVTPAAYMKTIGKLPDARTLGPVAKKQVAEMADAKVSAGSSTLRRLEPVRVTTGSSAADLDDVTASLAERIDGFRGVTASGLAVPGGADSGADYPLVAGGNIAVSYGYGAIGEASVGTVTVVCGDEVFAFGHPGYWNSKLSANIHGASAARIVPDLTGAYKLVSAIGKVKGTLVDDRLAGVRGLLGDAAPVVPIKTTSTVGTTRSTTVSYISEEQLIAAAAFTQLGNEVPRMLDNVQEASAKVSWSITYRRADGTTRKLNNSDAYADKYEITGYIGMGVADDIAMLQANPFEDIEIVSVQISSVFEEDYRKTRLAGVQLLKKGVWTTVGDDSITKVTRGQTYSFRAVLAPVPGSAKGTQYSPFVVTVPADAQKITRITLVAPSEEDEWYYEEDPSGSFAEYISSLDANRRSDVFERVRSYTSLSGVKTAKRWNSVAPTVIAADGARVTFRLEVPVKR
jgi:hypothetical protein